MSMYIVTHIIFRQLQVHPFVDNSYTRICEPFFVVNGFWELRTKQHCLKMGQRRSALGLQRSSPKYADVELRRIAHCYFTGRFDDRNMQAILIDINVATMHMRTVSSNAIDKISQKLFCSSRKLRYTKSFMDCLHAYIHSPIQTQQARIPMDSIAAESAFRNFARKIKIRFFVQRVQSFDQLHRWPKSAIVSVCFFLPKFSKYFP